MDLVKHQHETILATNGATREQGSAYIGIHNIHVNDKDMIDPIKVYHWQEILVIKRVSDDIVAAESSIISMAVACCNEDCTKFAVHNLDFQHDIYETEVIDVTKLPSLGPWIGGQIYHLAAVDKYYICSKANKESCAELNVSRCINKTLFNIGDIITKTGLPAIWKSTNGTEVEIDPGDLSRTDVPTEECDFYVEMPALNTIKPDTLSVKCHLDSVIYHWQAIKVGIINSGTVDDAIASVVSENSIGYCEKVNSTGEFVFVKPNKDSYYIATEATSITQLPTPSSLELGKLYVYNGTYYILSCIEEDPTVTVPDWKAVNKTTGYAPNEAISWSSPCYVNWFLSDGNNKLYTTLSGASHSKAASTYSTTITVTVYVPSMFVQPWAVQVNIRTKDQTWAWKSVTVQGVSDGTAYVKYVGYYASYGANAWQHVVFDLSNGNYHEFNGTTPANANDWANRHITTYWSSHAAVSSAADATTKYPPQNYQGAYVRKDGDSFTLWKSMPN